MINEIQFPYTYPGLIRQTSKCSHPKGRFYDAGCVNELLIQKDAEIERLVDRTEDINNGWARKYTEALDKKDAEIERLKKALSATDSSWKTIAEEIRFRPGTSHRITANQAVSGHPWPLQDGSASRNRHNHW